MPDAHLTLATSLIEGTFRFLDMLVWPVCLVYVLSKPVVQTWITVLVDRIAEVVEVRHGRQASAATCVELRDRGAGNCLRRASDAFPPGGRPQAARQI
jgi:hypothetical protein